MNTTYAQDGVNVAQGDTLSALAANLMQGTWGNSPFVRINDQSRGNFRGPRLIETFSGAPPMIAASDGIGTKTSLHVAADTPEYAGHDLMAMVTSDILRYGGKPIFMGNVLDLRTTGTPGSAEEKFAKQLYWGLAEAARAAGVVVISGETAELGKHVAWDSPDSPIAFSWSATAVGIFGQAGIIDGSRLAEGQPIVALREQGFRSNGISSVRAAFAAHFGVCWWESMEARIALEDAAVPSALYDKLLSEALGWESDKRSVDITAIAHISGGGIHGKFGKDLLFRAGLSARLHNLFRPPAIMEECARWRNMPPQDRYSTWNGGQGMLVVVQDDDEAERLISIAETDGTDAQVCGRIGAKSDTPTLTIQSMYEDGGEVVYS